MGCGMTANIFISFASKDIKVAQTLCTALESRGFSCWISARDIAPGENFQVAIVRALRRARVMLLVFTANSNTSEEMTKELALASQQKIIVIPLRVEDVTPNEAFAYEFATRQWIDAFADWELSLDQLSRRLTHALSEDDPRAADAPKIESAPVVVDTPIAQAPPAIAEPVEVAREPDPVEAPSLAKSASKKGVKKEPEPEVGVSAEVVQLEAARSPKPELEPEQKADRRRSLVLPIAAAVAVTVAGIVAASSLMKAPAAGPAIAANPRLAPALVVTPAAPPEDVIAPPEEEAPRLVKSANKKAVKKEAEPEVDIPY